MKTLTLPWTAPSPYRRRKIIQGAGDATTGARPMRANARAILIEALGDAHRWLNELLSDPRQTLKTLASREVQDRAIDPDDNEDRLIDRPAHRRDPRHLVDRRTDDGEVEPLLAADVAVEYHAEMEAEIHVGRRQAFGEPAFVERLDRLARFLGRVERGGASYTAIHHVLTNPVYAGAYAYGKSRRETMLNASGVRRKRVRKGLVLDLLEQCSI